MIFIDQPKQQTTPIHAPKSSDKAPAAGPRSIARVGLGYLSVIFCLFLSAYQGPDLSAQNIVEPIPLLKQEVFVPKSLSLCGEPIPLENPAVWEMLDREMNISVWDHAQVFMWLKRSSRYFPYIEKKLAEAGLPDDLKYVAVAESALQTNISSNAGALGPWQFLAHTGRSQGLRKDYLVDERLSFEYATETAIKYLQYLKKRFETWSLVMAAYNCGETTLQKEINEQKIRDFYRLNLPLETERYVFRIASIKLVLESPERYGYKLLAQNRYHPIETDTVTINLKSNLHITTLAQAIGTDFKVIKELNPQFINYYLPSGTYPIKVPAGLGEKILAYLQKGTNPPHTDATLVEDSDLYIVQPGDSLIMISRKTHIPLETLFELNNLQDSLIKPGQKLRLKP